jgi:WhiB family redox-sensing transcriptional regulator
VTVGQVARLPRPLSSSYAWQAEAACTDGDPTLFFHPDRERGPARRLRDLQALAVCSTCPVLDACRQHALSVREPYGVWGGMTESQRQPVQAGRRTLFPEVGDAGTLSVAGA